MVGDVIAFHGLPILDSPARGANGHTKQQQQQQQQQKYHSPCTTQAPLPAATGYCKSSTAWSLPIFETFLPVHFPRSSQSPGRDVNGTQENVTSRSQHDAVSGEQQQQQGSQHGSERPQKRTKGMWPSRQIESDYYDGYEESQRLASEMEASGCSTTPLAANPLQDSNGYEAKVSSQRAWQSGSQNPLHHPTWRPFHLSNQARDHQPLYYSDRLGLATPVEDVHSSSIDPSSFVGVVPNQKFEPTEPEYFNCVPATSTFSSYHVDANAALTSTLPPCSNTLAIAYEDPRSVIQDGEENMDHAKWEPEEEEGMCYKDEPWCPEDSPPSTEAQGGKVDEPYAQLIYKAFMSTPTKSMSLQEIYKWFRENTDKAKGLGKGWQNSIRHNLSMNAAFTKRNSKAAVRDPNDGSLTFDPASDGRKATEWFLESEFLSGVESTTRYRRGNSGSRARQSGGGGVGGSGGHARGSRHGGSTHSAGYSDKRVSAGRKGGNVAAQNRRRLAEKQQRAREQVAAQESDRHQQEQQQQQQQQHEHEHDLRFAGPVPVPAYHEFPDHHEGVAVQYYPTPAHHPPPTSSPTFHHHGFGGVGEAMDQSQCQAQDAEQMEIDSNNNNYFQPSDVGASVEDNDNDHYDYDYDHHDSEGPATLRGDSHAPRPNEPITPPDCAAASMQVQQGGDIDGGGGGKQYDSMVGMVEMYHVHPMDNPHHQHQHQHQHPHAHAHAAYGGDPMHGMPLLPGYTLGSVTGIYEAPPGGHQPPVFFDTADSDALQAAGLYELFVEGVQH